MTVVDAERRPPLDEMPSAGPRGAWSRPLLGAAAAAITGLPATAMGAGLAGRYLQKVGMTWLAVAGLFMLAAGLVMVAYAANVYWRAARRWRRLWFVPAVVVSVVVIWSLAMATMLSFVPRSPLGTTTPADRGLTYTDVTFRTSDGVQLSAWWVPSTNHAAVVLLAGSGSTRAATLPQAVVLARHGYGALLVDARGQGRSGGSAMDAGWYGDADVTAAVTFLLHEPGIRPDGVAVLGLSMGGEEAVGAAAADPRVRAVVAEGATNRTAADKAGWLPSGVDGVLQRGIDWLTYSTVDLLSPAPSPTPLHTAVAHATTARFLFITAGSMPDERRAAFYFRTAAPDRVAVWTVDGAAHTHGLQTRPAEWETQVISFLERSLTTVAFAG